MPVVLVTILTSVASAVGGVLLKMLMGILTNKQFIEDAFLYVADKLVKHTATDADDKILELAKAALAHAEARDNPPALPEAPTT